jgi:hypothetical protein
LIGGETTEKQSQVAGVTEVYDLLEDTWRTEADMPAARRDLRANVVEAKN